MEIETSTAPGGPFTPIYSSSAGRRHPNPRGHRLRTDRGSEVPVTPGFRLHDILTVSLGGNRTIDHVITHTGGPAQGTATMPVKIVNFP